MTKRRAGDGLSPFQRLRLHLASSELWVRFSEPLAYLLLGAAALAVIGGVAAMALGSAHPDQASELPTIRVSSLVLSQPVPSELSEPGEPRQPDPVQPFDQPIGVEVWRTSTFVWPAAGKITAFFGAGDATGITIETDSRVDVRASARGVVTTIESLSEDRFSVSIEHEGDIKTLYSNLATVAVAAGQRIERRQVIGKTAEPRGVGGRLHFELVAGGQTVDPLRFLPASYLDPALGGPESSNCTGAAFAVDPASSVTVVYAADLLRSYSIQEATVLAVGESTAPEVEARPKGPLSLLIAVPSRPNKSPAPLDYVLETIFGNGTEQRRATCAFSLLQASLIPPAGAAELRLTPTAIPSPKATSTTVLPFTPTPKKSETPALGSSRTATLTPSAPGGTASPTRSRTVSPASGR